MNDGAYYLSLRQEPTGMVPDQTVTFTGSSVFKQEMKDEVRRIALSSSSCCPPSEVKPCPLWVLVPAAVEDFRPNLLRQPSGFLSFLLKAQRAGKSRWTPPRCHARLAKAKNAQSQLRSKLSKLF